MKLKLKISGIALVGFLACNLFHSDVCNGQKQDTIRVLTYNVLGWESQTGCQGPNVPLYAYLDTIAQFANADIMGLDKLQCVKTSASDVNGLSSPYFPDSIIYYSLDKAFPNRYAWCPFTDLSRCLGGSSQIVFYDQNKLGYISTTPMYYGQEDFDMFKLYYKQWFGSSNDTTFLYVILCHTISSGTTDTGRDGEDSIVMNNVRAMFTHTPNLIYMGDFNTRESDESGYAYITQTSDTNYVMDDPPFHPDGHLTYPDIWHSGNSNQAYFTTTTRETTLPNSCGTTGGAKDWYDHILISPWIVNGEDNITYVRNSYKTIGNDGNRAGISVNTGTNNSAPPPVINSLFNFSDKYPVEITLAVNPVLSVKNIQSSPGSIKVNNPIGQNNNMIIHFATFLNGQNVSMAIYDVCGRNLGESVINVSSSVINKNISLTPGVYFIHFSSGGYTTTLKVVEE
jgi:hypothetical protein